MFGAPFDWRMPSCGQDEYFDRLKALVEHASTMNGGIKLCSTQRVWVRS